MTDSSPALLPFRGLRFRSDLPGGLSATIGPPYDLDSSDEARAFVAERPYCSVRLEVDDTGNGLTFKAARTLLAHWRQQQVIVQDTVESYYVYEQRFEHDGEWFTRRGIFGLVPVDEPAVDVLPHEETWEENRERRVQLLRELEAAPSPVYLIYKSAGNSPAALLAAVAATRPDACATDISGTEHRLWVVSDPSMTEQLSASMQNQHFVIADGHHRFAAARQYHDEQRRPETALVLACCVEAQDPGIVIRPIHRLIRSRDAIDLATATGMLSGWFDISSSPVGERSGRDLRHALTDGILPEAGIITNGGLTFTHLRLRDWSLVEPLLPGDQNEPANQLDVTVITELLIRRALQLDPASEAIDYFDDAEDILALARKGTGLGLLMRPIRLSQVFAVARSGDTVPGKSTSFVPKIPVGLVMHDLSGSRRGTRDEERGGEQ